MALFKTPNDLRYTREHEWARLEADGTLTVGITDYAQDALGDITFLELPQTGRSLAANETFGVVESVKTYSDLYSPVAGEVVAINEALVEDPSQINVDAYAHWLIRLRPASLDDVTALLDAAAYEAHTAS
jgi:glycine cleavage system H protein